MQICAFCALLYEGLEVDCMYVKAVICLLGTLKNSKGKTGIYKSVF